VVGGFASIGLLLAGHAVAQTPEIVVTGRPLPRPAGAEAYGSVLIDGERLRETASGRLEGALRDVAGFQTFRRADSRAAHPTAQGANLRALGGNASGRVLVLLDGVPQADLFAGWTPWTALVGDDLVSVRVTRGGGAGPFGSGALAGVIELQSSGPEDAPRFAAHAAVGERDSIEASARGSVLLGEAFLAATVRADRGDGWFLVPERQRGPIDRPARYDQRSASLRAVAPLGPGELQLRAARFEDERLRGLPGAENANEGTDLSARFVGLGDWPVEASIYRQERGFRSRFASARDERTSETPTLEQYDTPAEGWGGKLEVRPPIGERVALQVGADLRRVEGETRERFRFQNGAFTRGRGAGGRTSVTGLYAEASVDASERLTLTGGVRLDRWTVKDGRLRETELATGASIRDERFADRDGTETTARAGALWRASDAVRWRAAAYAGFRLPTLNELYRPFRVGADATAANPELAPERLSGIEAGADATPAPGVRLSATVFRNRLEDAIGNVTRGLGPGSFPQVGFVGAGGAYRVRENLRAIDATGLEAQVSVERGRFGLDGALTLTDATVDAPGLELDGRRPAQSARVQASVTGRWTPTARSAVALTLRHTGRQFEDDLESRDLRAATTLDAYARLPLRPGLALELRGENLTAEEVQAGVSAAGVVDLAQPRTLWIGVRFEAR
jgi:outer membrane receptor protein involved in Fe transport